MKVRLLKHVLVDDGDMLPTRAGKVVILDDVKARAFIQSGLAEALELHAEPEVKMAPEPENKMLRVPLNKGARR